MNAHPHTYVIAEAGVNHNGSVELAVQLVDAAAESGADAVKFQTFNAAELASKSAGKAAYQVRNTGEDDSQLEMLRKLELDEKVHKTLARHCQARKIQFLSTPFDSESLELLVNKFDLPFIKVSSGDITNAPFLLEIAKTQKPVILSTGMSTLGEVEQALGVLAFGYTSTDAPSLGAFERAYASEGGQQVLASRVTLLHCTSEYPAPLEDVNLRAIETMRKAFSLPVGYSDHTAGIAIPVAAAALGAVVIEKHFTLDRALPGPDHKASLEPLELAAMVKAIREIGLAMGTPLKRPSLIELENRLIGRKSLVARNALKKGDLFSPQNLTVKRPGGGVSPMCYWEWVGKEAGQDYAPDEVVSSSS
jgi:N-acetylneuraminate synthase